MTDDVKLLERFTAHGDESAFRALVERHINLVYSTARRVLNGDTHLAEDVAQKVFTDFARKARTLPSDTVLTGWFYEAARFAASNTIRGERRRRTREEEAFAMQQLASDSAAEWEQLHPVLDDAMGELSVADRNALLLRYFENQDFHSVGRALGVSADAAQKRVSRAVERLREFLSQRGVTVSASGLVVLISTNAVFVAPAGLSAAIFSSALGGASLVTNAVTKGISMTALQQALITAALITAVGLAIHEARRALALQNQVSALQQQHAALAEQLMQEHDEALRQLATRQKVAERDTNMTELLRLRGEVARLRRDAQELARPNPNSTSSPGKLPVVVGILVTNLEPRVTSEDQICAIIQTRIGEAYSPLSVDRDVRNLYGTSRFSNVRVTQTSNELGITLTYQVKERAADVMTQVFSNVGAATPEAAFQTFLWAAKAGDSNLLSQTLRWRKETEDAVSDDLADQVTAAQARGVATSFTNLAGFRILGQKSETSDTVRMRVEFNQIDGRTRRGEIYMIREQGEWKPTWTFSRREGSRAVSTQFLLPITPELGPVN